MHEGKSFLHLPIPQNVVVLKCLLVSCVFKEVPQFNSQPPTSVARRLDGQDTRGAGSIRAVGRMFT